MSPALWYFMSSEHIFYSVANLCIRNLNIMSAKTQLWPLQSSTYYDKEEHLMIQCNNNNIKKRIIHLNDTMGGMVFNATLSLRLQKQTFNLEHSYNNNKRLAHA